MYSACTRPDGQIQQKSVLVIEDDVSVGACFVEAIIQETPYMAFLVTESYHALAVLKEIKPDIILLDYLLPQMNGLDLYDYLHTHKSLRDIPVIMISASLPQEEINRRQLIGLQKPEEINRRQLIGLQKPFDIDDLLTILEGVLIY